MEEATFLTRFARSVTIVHRRSALQASQVMQNHALSDDKISFLFDSEITELEDKDGKLSGLTVRNTLTEETQHLDVTGLFIAIGHDPAHRTVHRTARPRRRGLPQGPRPVHAHHPPRRLRRG